MDRKPKSNKIVRISQFFVVVLMVGSYAFLGLAGYLQDQGYEYGVHIGIIGFVGSSVLALILIYWVFPESVALEMEKKHQKLAKKVLSQYSGISRSSIEDKLIKRRFRRLEGDIYTKKVFSFFKDSITFIVHFSDSDSLKKAIDHLDQDLDPILKKISKGNVCIICVIQKPMFSDQDKSELLEACMNLYINESFATVSMLPTNAQLVPVVIDPYRQTLFLTDFYSNRSIQLYDYGIRLIKKLIA